MIKALLFGRSGLSSRKYKTFSEYEDGLSTAPPAPAVSADLPERRRQPIDPQLLLALREDVAILNARISKVEGYLLAGFTATASLQAGFSFFGG